MKLKKILSLAAAGVMAVSMLTACGEGANEIIDPTPNPTPSASTVVSTFEDAIKAHSKATVNVVESEKLNARIDAINDKLTYAEMMPNGKADEGFVDAIESAFGEKDEMKNLMEGKKPAALECGTHWYYAVVDAGAVSGTTALNWAANEIADRMSALEDEYIRDELMHGVGAGVVVGGRYNKKPGRPDHGKPDTVVGGVVFEQNVAHTADYTMFVKQVNMTATGDTEVPITIAVLKVNVAEKV